MNKILNAIFGFIGLFIITKLLALNSYNLGVIDGKDETIKRLEDDIGRKETRIDDLILDVQRF